MTTELLEKTEISEELKELIENIDEIKATVDLYSVLVEKQLLI